MSGYYSTALLAFPKMMQTVAYIDYGKYNIQPTVYICRDRIPVETFNFSEPLSEVNQSTCLSDHGIFFFMYLDNLAPLHGRSSRSLFP